MEDNEIERLLFNDTDSDCATDFESDEESGDSET
jgi:hypothetical protein